jgi:hypothetical protein
VGSGDSDPFAAYEVRVVGNARKPQQQFAM